MQFPQIPYMEWAKTHEDAGFPVHCDLANSGMPTLPKSISDLGIDPENIPLAGNNSYGYQPLKERIAQRYGVDPNNVLTALGTSMSNFIVLASIIEPGDTVLVETPVYECLSYPPSALGAHIVGFERHESSDWRVEVDRIADLTKQNRAKAIFLSNPHNPSGAFDDDATLIALADAVDESCWLIVDEVYREWLDGEYGKTVALKRPNIITTTSLTKVWGLSSLRAGWAIGPESMMLKCYKTYDHMAVISPFPTDWIIAELFNQPEKMQEFRDRGVESVKKSRAIVDAFLTGPAAGRITGSMPSGGGFATLKLAGMSGAELADSLFREQGVNLVSGHFFGVPNGFRLSWTRGEEIVQEGLTRFTEWLLMHPEQ